jgi:Undecaprenyl-phosphate galactose phosphotransferase WbaP
MDEIRVAVPSDESGKPLLHPRRLLTFQRHARLWMSSVLLLTDLLRLVAAGLLAVGLRSLFGQVDNLPEYLSLFPFTLIFLAANALSGLYPAVGLAPPEEMRRLSTTTTVVYLLATAFTFFLRSAEIYSRLVFTFFWVIAIFALPINRLLVRAIAVRQNMWGEPVAVIGSGPRVDRISEYLLQRMHLGLRPAVILDISPQISDQPDLLPRLDIGSTSEVRLALKRAGISTALLVVSELPHTLQDTVINPPYGFRRTILITDLNWIGSLGVTPYDLEGSLGLEVHQNLLNPWQRGIKRLFDTLFSLMLGLLAMPFFLLIALLIRLDSAGSILYTHKRIGLGGRLILVYKFRTMYQNADEVLQRYLVEHIQKQAEWQRSHKLPDDPRITRAGKFLRRTSLDELPQLLNVLKSEMSLVGPRPFLPDEIGYYQKGFALYQRVRPGITGLWQVSGRGDLSLEDRVRYDEYYIRNWSIWLDIYILLRTVWVVLRGEGAY